MSDQKYDVVFSGELLDGFTVEDVKRNFANVFRVPPEKIEPFFSSPRVVLKANVDRKTADKYKAVLTKTGAVVTLEPRQPEGAPAEPVSESPAEAPEMPSGAAAPASKNVGPVWGRKVENTAIETTAEPVAGEGGQYGSLERGVSGNYRFDIGETLSEAWQKVSGNKLTVFLAGLIYMAIMIAFGIVTGLINAILTHVAGTMGGGVGELLTQIAQIAVSAPLGAGFVMLGVSMAIGVSAGPGSILGYYDRILPLAITALLYGLMVLLGFLLLIIPGIYLSVAYILAIPLVADKGLSPWQALETSRKAVTHQWFAVFALLLILGLLTVAGFLCFMIGLIWVMPLYLIAIGLLYRNIFGVSSVVAE